MPLLVSPVICGKSLEFKPDFVTCLESISSLRVLSAGCQSMRHRFIQVVMLSADKVENERTFKWIVKCQRNWTERVWWITGVNVLTDCLLCSQSAGLTLVSLSDGNGCSLLILWPWMHLKMTRSRLWWISPRRTLTRQSEYLYSTIVFMLVN